MTGFIPVPPEPWVPTATDSDSKLFPADTMTALDEHNDGRYATTEQGEKADSAYQKPEAGVPASDLEEAVQTSLGKADSAYQLPEAGVPATDLEDAVRTSLGKADGAAQKDQNLNDVVDKAAARTNLDVFSKAEANAAIADQIAEADDVVAAAAAAAAGAATTAVTLAGVSDSYETPPVAPSVPLGTLVPVSAGTQPRRRLIIALDTPVRVSQPSVVRSMSAKVMNDEVGRQAEFYVLRSDGGGGYTVVYASGLVDAGTGGVVSHVPSSQVRVQAGDLPAVWTSTATDANGVLLAASGGNPIGQVVYSTSAGYARLTEGATVTPGAGNLSTVQTILIPAILWVVDSEAVTVASRWAGKPGGYPRLDQAAHLDARNGAAGFASAHPYSAASGGQEVEEFDPALRRVKRVLRPSTADVGRTLASPTGNTTTVGTYPTGRFVVPWSTTWAGFAADGVLTRVQFPPGGTRNTGAKLQVWVVRPSAPLSTTVGEKVTFLPVASVGEVTFTDTTRPVEITGLHIPVTAGDMLAFRPLNAGMLFGSGSTAFLNDRYVDAVFAGTSLDDLTPAGFAGTVTAERRFDHIATVITGPFRSAASTPFGTPRLDAAGMLPGRTRPAEDNYWRGRKIVALGTSITAASGGFVYQAIGDMLGADLDNQAEGESGIRWSGTRAKSLAATQAELTAAGFTAYVGQSYEVKVLGKNADLYVFDHGYNDRGAPIGAIDDTDPSTFYGAYNRVLGALLAEKPTAQIAFITPHSLYAPSNEGYHANTAAIRAALLALGEKYAAPVLDFTMRLQLSSAQAATFLPDTVHPDAEMHQRMARQLYGFIRNL